MRLPDVSTHIQTLAQIQAENPPTGRLNESANFGRKKIPFQFPLEEGSLVKVWGLLFWEIIYLFKASHISSFDMKFYQNNLNHDPQTFICSLSQSKWVFKPSKQNHLYLMVS